MVQDHKKDLSEFKKEASSGNDTSIKDAASQGVQVISEHLQMAQQMAQKHNVQMGDAMSNDMSGQPAGHREQQH
jgi:putative membrane protein